MTALRTFGILSLRAALRSFYPPLSQRTLDLPLLVALAFSLISCRIDPVSAQSSPPLRVAKIVDGDTVRLAFPWGTESVRLIGIDTPESRENQRAYRQAIEYRVSLKTILSLGKEATRHLENLAPRGTIVTLEYDRVKRDKYGRHLAYLSLSNGIMLNKQMIDDGLAAPLSMKPNTRYEAIFSQGAQSAQQEKRGIWRYVSVRSATTQRRFFRSLPSTVEIEPPLGRFLSFSFTNYGGTLALLREVVHN